MEKRREGKAVLYTDDDDNDEGGNEESEGGGGDKVGGRAGEVGVGPHFLHA
ncbi:conserved hypothetical protein [Ricinus communis]|uniref:Uncharacterized protein n=1 Tax=Ricinus communis TaxID=3988 RepID=B9SDP6_RICCO|nr:conserved hypothetical protein [Ricinus communis]